MEEICGVWVWGKGVELPSPLPAPPCVHQPRGSPSPSLWGFMEASLWPSFVAEAKGNKFGEKFGPFYRVSVSWASVTKYTNGMAETDICCLPVLEATSPSSRCRQSHTPSEGCREGWIPGVSPHGW